MDINNSAINFEYVTDNEQTNVEQIEPNVCSFEPNINLITNNITTTTETDPLELSLNIAENYGLPPCFVELSRCDNIWKTFQLIRDLQEDVPSECSGNDNDTETHEDDEPASSMNDNESYSSSTQANNTMAPYIKYQPVLNNGNSALNFQFSVKSTRLLYQCHECGKQYSHRSTLREHSERIHNIILPAIRKKSENPNNDSKSNHSKNNNDLRESNEINNDDNTSVSNQVHENSTTDKPDDGALLDNLSDTHVSEKERFITQNNFFTCQYCNRQYKDKYYFNYHLKHSHGTSISGIRTYNKRTNNNGTSEQSALKKNRRVQQVDQSRNLNVHRCNTCGKHFYDKARLGCHQRKVHGLYANKSNQRNRINNRFQSTKSTSHQLTTPNSLNAFYVEPGCKVIPCAFCDKVYRERQGWKYHMNKVHDIKFAKFNKELRGPDGLIPCQECGRKYTTNRALFKHLFSIHRQQLHQKCDICELRFPNTDSLIKHSLDIHKTMLLQRITQRSKDRPHKCPVCFTHYGMKTNLKFHLIQAHGIRNAIECIPEKNSPTKSVTHKSRIEKQPNSMLSNEVKKNLRDKMRINYNEATESRSIEQLLLGDKTSNEENVDASEKVGIGNVVLCFLCQRRCIKIRKHFIDYHKIRHPEELIAQCKPVSSTNDINCSVKNVAVSKEGKKNEKTKKSNRKVKRGRYRDMNSNPDRLFIKIFSANDQKLYKCKICPDYVRNKYELLRKHEKQHKRQEVHLPITNSEINSPKQTNSQKGKRASVDNRGTRSRRLSDSTEHTRTTRASIKLKEEREFRCAVCDRLFRNAEILSSHKISCVAYHADNSSMNDASDTRESSDRDSGIGISITIKKKNDSYEIVGREGNEEEKIRNSDNKNRNQLENEVSASNNSIDAFTVTPNNKDDGHEKSFPYSKFHRVVKLRNVEDIDVDIDFESTSNSPAMIECESNQEVTSSGQNDMSETLDEKIVETTIYQVPTLKQLCEKALAKTKDIDKLPYQCRICSKAWASRISLNLHMRIHTKSCRHSKS